MNFILFIILLFSLTSCGYKGPPTPIFPTSPTQFDKEIEKRQENHDEKKLSAN